MMKMLTGGVKKGGKGEKREKRVVILMTRWKKEQDIRKIIGVMTVLLVEIKRRNAD